MQAKLERGKAAFRMHGVGLSVAILASATLSLSAPGRALAACGGSSHPAHAASTGTAGVHVGTSTAAASDRAGRASTGRGFASKRQTTRRARRAWWRWCQWGDGPKRPHARGCKLHYMG